MSLVNVSDSTPSLRNSRGHKYSDEILAGLEKKEKAEADYVKYLMALLSAADSLGQVKQILSDKGELSEGMREDLDRAINQEEKEQKKASEVPIQLIIKKIQMMKNRERISELNKLYNKNEVELKKYEHCIFDSTRKPTQSESEERQVLSNLGSGFLAEILWINKNLNPRLCTGEEKEKLTLAESWPYSVSNLKNIVSDSTSSLLRNRKGHKYSKRALAFFEKKDKAEADYEKYLMEILSSADSLGQVKQILSDKGELSEDMREALDRAINQEEKEQEKEREKALKVHIYFIIKKIQIEKNRKREYEIKKLLKKNKADFKRKDRLMYETTISKSEIDESQVILNLQLDLWTEYLWIDNKLSPFLYTGEDRSKFESADSWPDHIPKFQDTKKSCLLSYMQRKISQESDMDESDSDENAYEDSLINVSGISLE